MILFKKATDLRHYLDAQEKAGLKTGFVPTMGALHAGHISLVTESKTRTGLTVCSIFVNPAQFNDPADFDKYPITLDKDIYLLEKARCDVLFLPSKEEIYPPEYKKETYELGYLETVLEGKYRPGHFQGVCMVVHRLLDMVKPSILYLGQKDYQQCMVISRLLSLTGLDTTIKLRISPTVRETDGLAMSSRNMRLNAAERERATALFKALNYIRENIAPGPVEKLKITAAAMLMEKGLQPDYVEVADADDLSLISNWDGSQKIVALVAAYNNEVRLIDNMLLNEPSL